MSENIAKQRAGSVIRPEGMNDTDEIDYVDRVADLAANQNLDTRHPGRVTGTRELAIPPSHVIPFRVEGVALQVIQAFRTRHRWPRQAALKSIG